MYIVAKTAVSRHVLRLLIACHHPPLIGVGTNDGANSSQSMETLIRIYTKFRRCHVRGGISQAIELTQQK